MSWCVIKGNKFVFILLILACGWRLSLNQLNDCVVGEVTCPRCDKNQFGVNCLSCNCDPFGSLKSCDPVSGACYCRRGVTGRRCNICSRRGSLGPSITANQAACLQCFCNGYSSSCTSADNWFVASVSNYFNLEGVTGNWRENNGGRITWEEEGFMRVEGVAGRVELLFPAEYLSDKRTLFGQQFLVTLRQSSPYDNVVMVTVKISTTTTSPFDDGLQLEMSPVGITNSWKTIKVTDQMIVSDGGLASEDHLRRVLANISVVTLVAVGTGDITIDILTVHLDYATPTVLSNGIADYVETCQCPPGRHGQFCEECSQGYARDPPNGGPFAACVKCYCSNKATSCDPETGSCHNCTDNTGGDHCEHCADGYYRNMTTGVCLPCSCPGQLGGDNYFATSCVAIDDHNVRCSCKAGYEGTACDECANGYYRHANGSCVACRCEVTTTVRCNRITGECTCSPGVTGEFCEVCEPGTTNLWPNCLACDNDCHNLWNNSLFQLTETVNDSISMVTSLNASSINVTLMDLDYLYELIGDIAAMVNSSSLNISQLNDVARLVTTVTEQVTTQLQLASTIEDNMVSINESEMMLLQKLERINKQLTDSLTELDNLQIELAVNNGTDLVAIVTESLERSSAAYTIISNEVALAIAAIANSSSDYQSKIDNFLPLENQLNELSSVVESITTFVMTVNSFLCGRCDLRDDCGMQCGGVLNASLVTANQIKESIQTVDDHLNTTNVIKDELQKFLHTVNSTLVLLNNAESLDLLSQANQQLDLINQLNNLTSDLLDRLNISTLLLIEAMANQSLMYELSLTPAEVADLVTMINTTISEFPLVNDYSDVIEKINNTLTVAMDSHRSSREVTEDAKSAASDLEELMAHLSNITTRMDMVEENSTSLEASINMTQQQVEEGEETLQMVHDALMSLNETVRSTNSTVNQNSRLASLLDKRITNIINIATNSSNEWKKTSHEVDELATNADNQATMSERIKIQSDRLLAEINKLLNITTTQQDIVNDLEATYTQQHLRHYSVVDDARSVHITLEGLISHINRITTINSFCVKTTCC